MHLLLPSRRGYAHHHQEELTELTLCKRPFSINTVELFHFALFSLLACPPNYIWQSWLENTFPGYTEKTPEQKLKRDGTDVAWSSESSETKDGGNTSTDLRQRGMRILFTACANS